MQSLLITFVFLLSIVATLGRINNYYNPSNEIYDFKVRNGKINREPVKQHPVILYEHENFKGNHHSFNGDSSDCINIPSHFGDKSSSVRQGPRCTIIYEHEHCYGKGKRICGNHHAIQGNLKDTISAIKFAEPYEK